MGESAEPASELRRLLFLIWNSGGGTQPAIGLGRRLAARGHKVRFLAPRTHRSRVEAAGCLWEPIPAVAEFDPSKGRALEDQWDYLLAVLFDLSVAEGLLLAVEREAPDVLVIDYQLSSGLSAAERTGLPAAALFHTAFHFHGVTNDPAWWRDATQRINRTRAELAMPAVDPGDEAPIMALSRRLTKALVVMPEEFDVREAEPPPNLIHVGPIFEEEPSDWTWDLPWTSEDQVPLVIVSMGSQYMHQEDLIARTIQALDGLPVRTLVTTGFELAPEEVDAPPSVVVRRYVPHVAVLPHAALVVTHGGMGTIMAAFAFGVPLLCMPLGRDQPANAHRVEALNAGRALDLGADQPTIRAAIVDVLGSEVHQAGARRMAAVVASYGFGARAVAELERL